MMMLRGLAGNRQFAHHALSGDKAADQKQSLAWADALKDLLAKAGVPGNRLTTAGLIPEHPVASNDTTDPYSDRVTRLPSPGPDTYEKPKMRAGQRFPPRDRIHHVNSTIRLPCTNRRVVGRR
jgi:outer membrane protein OmpA-like peptidoglycan-associated protein